MPSASAAPARPRHPGARPWLTFLGSMNLAITLLVAIAVASVIGTVLQQNQPYNDYVLKFGPFWFEVYRTLGLFDVYHAPWFLLILVFLVVSTSVCVYRNAPVMLRDMRQWRDRVSAKSLAAFHNASEWTRPGVRAELADQAHAVLRAAGYRAIVRAHADHHLVAARRGGWNRVGYLLTHGAIVTICVGGLVDGNIPLMVREALGQILVETRNIPAAQMDARSILGAENASFRGTVSIPEGEAANFIYLTVRDGVLVQRLPFTVELKDFRIEHYDNGQPKSFESDLVIRDPERPEPVTHTIAVNHPLSYRGVTIYQAGFGDGGSVLKLRALPLARPAAAPVDLEGRINGETEVNVDGQPLVLEFTDFRPLNVHDIGDQGDGKRLHNVGPSFRHKVREPDGRAREFDTYMYPVPLDGRPVILAGMRDAPSEEFRYMHLPVGPDGSLARFMRFLALVHDEQALRRAADAIADLTLTARPDTGPEVREKMIVRSLEITRAFLAGGFAALEQMLGGSEAARNDEAAVRAYLSILRVMLGEIFTRALAEEGVDTGNGLGEPEGRFFQDLLGALDALPSYGAPFFLQLREFRHVEASGLEMTRAPGKYVVYLGCALLIAGVFMLFYLHPRRVWVHLRDEPGAVRVLLAGADTRTAPEFAREIQQLRAALEPVPGTSVPEQPS